MDKMNAEVRSSTGLKINIEGSPSEVSSVIRDIQKREFMFRRDLEFRHRRFEEEIYNNYNENIHHKKLSPIKEIRKLIQDGFLEDFKTLKEIREKIEFSSNTPMPNSSLHPTLTMLSRRGELDRKKVDGMFKYKLKGHHQS
ncbi:hypothetical protein KAT36_00355 [Candidatus Pacearchaeota archaeon]|nr:hypothetical protein [Candidatus Pacearchaeota archaeon]